MSDIVLSASVRQNLLSLQSTADLLATTQGRLATGKKVNSALDNPTNFFTAASLDARAGDINNLLDGIGNGVQVLQAANTGITSLQKLIDSAKSVANQALQTTLGYTKSKATGIAIPGATATNLLGTKGGVASTLVGTPQSNNHTGPGTAIDVTGAAVATVAQDALDTSAMGTVAFTSLVPGAATGATKLGGTGAAADRVDMSALAGKDLVINGVHIKFDNSDNVSTTAVSGTVATGFTINIGDASLADFDDLLGTIDTITGNTGTASNVSAAAAPDTGKLVLHTGAEGAGADISFNGSDPAVLSALGFSSNITRPLSITPAATHPVNVSGNTRLGIDTTTTALTAGQSTLAPPIADGASFTVNGKTIAFYTGPTAPTPPADDTTYISIATGSVQSVLNAIDAAIGKTGSATIDPTGKININSDTKTDLTITDGTPTGALGAFGLTAAAGNHPLTYAAPTTNIRITADSPLKGPANAVSTGLQSPMADGDEINVNGKTIHFYDSTGTPPTSAGPSDPDITYLDVATSSVGDVLDAIDAITGAQSASGVVGGKVTLVAGTDQDLVVSGTGLAKLGLSDSITAKSTAPTSGLTGLTLTIGVTGNSSAPVTVVFGTDDASGEVSSLDELNAQLMKNNVQASINSQGAITLTTINDAASSDLGAITGTITDPGNPFAGITIDEAVTNQDSQATRADLVRQYNNIIDQIRTTAQDSSYNGINLLNGDQLKLIFNETGTSTLNVTGNMMDADGLGLGLLAAGTDFIDNASTNKIMASLSSASSYLRSQASALGSNLSVVQIRQDFSKNLINVLQTGSTNLTIADTNEEAANSQALSTRQSIAVSALALANQSQQSVLQLLR